LMLSTLALGLRRYAPTRNERRERKGPRGGTKPSVETVASALLLSSCLVAVTKYFVDFSRLFHVPYERFWYLQAQRVVLWVATTLANSACVLVVVYCFGVGWKVERFSWPRTLRWSVAIIYPTSLALQGLDKLISTSSRAWISPLSDEVWLIWHNVVWVLLSLGIMVSSWWIQTAITRSEDKVGRASSADGVMAEKRRKVRLASAKQLFKLSKTLCLSILSYTFGNGVLIWAEITPNSQPASNFSWLLLSWSVTHFYLSFFEFLMPDCDQRGRKTHTRFKNWLTRKSAAKVMVEYERNDKIQDEAKAPYFYAQSSLASRRSAGTLDGAHNNQRQQGYRQNVRSLGISKGSSGQSESKREILF